MFTTYRHKTNNEEHHRCKLVQQLVTREKSKEYQHKIDTSNQNLTHEDINYGNMGIEGL